MKRPLSAAAAAALLALGAVGPGRRAGAQAQTEPARPSKSVYGRLESVDKTLNGLIMRSDAGERLSWRFSSEVIAEAARYKTGDPLIVIYRQDTPNEKRVTAVAFPGSATSPTYMNLTGSRVVIRSAPAVGGACSPAAAGPISESTIPIGGVAEVLEGCWCCAQTDQKCTPSTRSGLGNAFLVRCFE